MKTLVAIVAVALAGGSYVALSQEGQQPPGQRDQGERYGAEKQQHQTQGIQVWKPSQAEWKQADKMPQGVMKAKVHEGKNGAVYLMKFPAGTKVPAQVCQTNKVIHVHHGRLEFGQGQAGAGQERGLDQDKNRQTQPGQQDRGFSQGGQGQSASDGDIVKISQGTTFWFTASSETLAVVATDGPMKSDASGQSESPEEENKVK
jgi:hypothetical protein